MNSTHTARSALYVGWGRGDITGPVVGQRFFGYGNLSQTGAGFQQRLYARALMIDDGVERVLFLHLDLGILSELLRHRILTGLERKLPGVFRPSHVLMSATHTHAAPGGYSSYLLYAAAVVGYAQRTIDRIVQGAVSAAVDAFERRAPGAVKLTTGDLEGACINRSVEAFQKNPAEDRILLPSRYEPKMHQLSLHDAKGALKAIVNWFGVHGTNYNKHNRLVSGDNKGCASWIVEHAYGRGFVAAFPQGASADLSPNLRAHADGTFEGEGRDNRESAELIGRRQAQRALELAESPAEELHGPVTARLAYVDFDDGQVPADFSSFGQAAAIGPAVLGQSFIAGTKDGRGLDWVDEGMSQHRVQVRLMAKLTGSSGEAVRKNHGSKLPFVRLSRGQPGASAVPTRLPLQVVRIGDFAVAAVPFEVTTMAGLRIRRRLARALGWSGTERVALCTLANAYASYLTTPEEYEVQRYEGASTLFGQEQLGFVEAELTKLAEHMLAGTEPPTLPAPEPPPLYELTFGNADREGADRLPPLVWYGDVFEDAPPEAAHDQSVDVTFWSNEPRHPLEAFSLLDVERFVGSDWVRVADDDDFATSLTWSVERGFARCTARWYVPSDAAPGWYRLVHRGRWISREGVPIPFSGSSRVFEVVPEAGERAGIGMESAPFLEGLDQEEVVRAESHLETRRVAAGTTVMAEGRAANEMACVLRGRLRVQVGDLELARLGPGDVVGEISFFDAGERSASVTALDDVELLVLTRGAYETLRAEGHRLAPTVERLALSALTTRLRRTDALLGRISGSLTPPPRPRTRERVASWLRSVERKRRGWRPPPAVTIEAALTTTKLLGDVDPELRRQIGAWFVPHRAHPNEAVCTQGESGDELFLVASGEVEVYVDAGDSSPEGARRIRVATLGPGEIFGMTGLIDGRRGATCIAVGSTRLFSLGKRAWERHAREDTPASSALRLAVIRAFCEQLRDTNLQLAQANTIEPRNTPDDRRRRVGEESHPSPMMGGQVGQAENL